MSRQRLVESADTGRLAAPTWRSWARHALVALLVALATWRLLTPHAPPPVRSEPTVTVASPLLRGLRALASPVVRLAPGRMPERFR